MVERLKGRGVIISPGETMRRFKVTDILESVKKKVTEEDYKIFVLHFVGLSEGEIGERLKISRAAVTKRWSEIKKKLTLGVLGIAK